MNRYIARGILEDLAAGRTVLVVSPSLTEGQHAHRALLDLAYTISDGDDLAYRWSLANGGQWLRDERTKVAATFASVRSAMIDHVRVDVVVVNGYRHMIDRGPGADDPALARLRAITSGRDTVVVD